MSYTKDEILNAVKIVRDLAGNPDVGVIAEFLTDLEKVSTPAKEARVVESKETR
jgi:hypothetical protein